MGQLAMDQPGIDKSLDLERKIESRKRDIWGQRQEVIFMICGSFQELCQLSTEKITQSNSLRPPSKTYQRYENTFGQNHHHGHDHGQRAGQLYKQW